MPAVPLISIITPAFNCEDTIVSTVRSVIDQSYENWELLIVDDASTDSTRKTLESLAHSDTRIRLIYLETNRGAAIARNRGLEQASSHMIAFLDSDDLWVPTKLEQQVNFMMSNNYGITFTSYCIMDPEGRPTGKRINARLTVDLDTYLKTTIIGCSTAIVNREIAGDFSFFDIRTRQDTHLWITLLSRGILAHGLDEPLVMYRARNDSISGNKLNASRQVWNLYFRIVRLGFWTSCYYFAHYAVNGIKKRI